MIQYEMITNKVLGMKYIKYTIEYICRNIYIYMARNKQHTQVQYINIQYANINNTNNMTTTNINRNTQICILLNTHAYQTAIHKVVGNTTQYKVNNLHRPHKIPTV